MIPASLHEAQAKDWRAAYRAARIEPSALLQRLGLDHLASRLPADSSAFPLRVTESFIARMRPGDPDDPLLRQVLPLDDEFRPQPGFALDAVGDLGARSARGVLHKYHGRVLLLASGSCAIHCRYCFRRHFPYAEEVAAADGWREAVDTIRADASIREVILSGGDPLALSQAKLSELTAALSRIAHVRRLRIHTRLPIVLPQRVDADLIDWLGASRLQRVMVVHANHANEFNADVDAALHQLRRSGVTLLNQAVLLRGVNDSVAAQVDLAEASFAAGVLPYYLHQLDRVQGAAHFLVDDHSALALHHSLRRRLPGYLVPRLVREVAGEAFKRPL